MNFKRRIVTAGLVAAAVSPLATTRAHAASEARAAVLYKNPQCDCCEGHAQHLRQSGLAVRVVETHDLALIKREQGVPEALEGCHTIVVGGYVVEGHVPARVVARLLSERPDLRGVSLPGMPLGSPGMGGRKQGPFTIYAIAREAVSRPAVYAVE